MPPPQKCIWFHYDLENLFSNVHSYDKYMSVRVPEGVLFLYIFVTFVVFTEVHVPVNSALPSCLSFHFAPVFVVLCIKL